MSRWNCRLCKTWGKGGPDAWSRHYRDIHQDDVRLGAQVSFGFSPNYSNGQRTRYRDDYVPAPRADEQP